METGRTVDDGRYESLSDPEGWEEKEKKSNAKGKGGKQKITQKEKKKEKAIRLAVSCRRGEGKCAEGKKPDAALEAPKTSRGQSSKGEHDPSA